MVVVPVPEARPQMHHFLVPIEEDRLAAGPVKLAAGLARVFGGVVEGLDAHAQNAALLAADPAAVAALPRATLQEQHRARRTRATFERLAAAEQLTEADQSGATGRAGSGPFYRWRAAEPLSDAEIAFIARLNDLTLLHRPQTDATSPRISLLENVLFESGRPLLLVPPSADGFDPAAFDIGAAHVLVAWNRSGETARAVALAMPLLRRAARVTVLTIHGWRFPGPEADELAGYLRAAGIAAEAVAVPGEWADAGSIIQAQARAGGCNLIVKGAYTQSRLRQLIFGGATRHLIWQSPIPVLMAH